MEALLKSLSWLEQAMSHVASNCLRIMFDRNDEGSALCDPFLFFHRFRPYIQTWTAIFEGQYEVSERERCEAFSAHLTLLNKLQAEAPPGMPSLGPHAAHVRDALAALQQRRRLCGPSGAMSTILPMCDAFLGVKMSSDELGQMLKSFEEYMPAEHRKALGDVRGHSARAFVLSLRDRGGEQAETLVDHFNACARRPLPRPSCPATILPMPARHRLHLLHLPDVRPGGGQVRSARS